MYYLLTFLCGFFGVLAAARSVERLIHGEPMVPAQMLIAIVGIALSVSCLRKARAARNDSAGTRH